MFCQRLQPVYNQLNKVYGGANTLGVFKVYKLFFRTK